MRFIIIWEFILNIIVWLKAILEKYVKQHWALLGVSGPVRASRAALSSDLKAAAAA